MTSIACKCPHMFPGHTAFGWMIGCKCEAAPSRQKKEKFEREKRILDLPFWKVGYNPHYLVLADTPEGAMSKEFACAACHYLFPHSATARELRNHEYKCFPPEAP